MAKLSKLIEAVSKVADECEALDPDSMSDAELMASLLMLRIQIDLVEAVFARCSGQGPSR